LKIYKNLGGFAHPMTQIENFGITPDKEAQVLDILCLLMDPMPDLIPEILRDDLDKRRAQA
jgi:hypothetical protein